MGTVDVFTKARAKAIEDNTIVSGLVDVNGKLILTKNNGATVDAGNVKGPKGSDSRYLIPNDLYGTARYVRLATIDGIQANAGGHLNAWLSGIGDRAVTKRATILLSAAQRSDNGFQIRAWGWDYNYGVGSSGSGILYYRQLGPYLYEIWYQLHSRHNLGYLTNLADWNSTINVDSISLTAPSGLIEVPVILGGPSATDASLTNKGFILTASDADVLAAVDDTKAVTPATIGPTRNFVNKSFNMLRMLQDFPCEMLDIEPLLQNNMKNYKTLVKTLGAEYYSQPAAFLSPNGWVTMRGILKHTAATTANLLLFTLPPGWRPQQNMLFPNYAIDSGMGVQAIQVKTNGQVLLAVPTLANTEQSLANICFNINAYSPLTLTSPFTSLDPTNMGVPSIYKSPDGIVHTAGGIQGGTVSNTAFLLPSGYTSIEANTEFHFPTANSNGGFAYSNISTVGNAYRPRITAAQYLTSAKWIAAGSPLDTLTASLQNAWANYGGAFPVAKATKTSDGMVMLNGLIKSGGLGTTAFTLPPGWRPRRNIIYTGVAADAFARIDVTLEGYVLPVAGGAASWMALDGIMFAAEI